MLFWLLFCFVYFTKYIDPNDKVYAILVDADVVDVCFKYYIFLVYLVHKNFMDSISCTVYIILNNS